MHQSFFRFRMVNLVILLMFDASVVRYMPFIDQWFIIFSLELCFRYVQCSNTYWLISFLIILSCTTSSKVIKNNYLHQWMETFVEDFFRSHVDWLIYWYLLIDTLIFWHCSIFGTCNIDRDNIFYTFKIN